MGLTTISCIDSYIFLNCILFLVILSQSVRISCRHFSDVMPLRDVVILFGLPSVNIFANSGTNCWCEVIGSGANFKWRLAIEEIIGPYATNHFVFK